MMSNVMLVTPPEQYFLMEAGDRPNLGVHYLAANLRKHGHNPVIMDLNHKSYQNMNAEIEDNMIDYIGMTTFTPYQNWTTEFAKHLKQNYPKIKRIAGGPHATVDPYSLTPLFDYVVQGEGERAIVEIVEGRANFNILSPPFERNLDSLPSPHPEIDRSYGMYQDGKLTATLQASRSCNFKCCFCTKDILGPYNRKFSLDRVFEEIDFLQSRGTNSFYFLDDSFTLNRKRAIDFADRVKEEGRYISFRIGSRTDAVDSELLDKLQEAGLRSLSFGLEHWDNNVLEIMDKQNDIENHANALDLCKDKGIKVHGSFIINLPGATAETAYQSFEKAMEYDLDFSEFYPMIAYPGTPIWNSPETFGCEIIDKSYSFHQTGGKTNIHNGFMEPEEVEEIAKYMKSEWAAFKGRPCPWESRE